MGLDIVELVFAVEDAFQIHLPDAEVSEVSTVGDLYDLVLSKLEGKDDKRCLTSAAFYRTRRGMVEALGVERREVKPSTPLEQLFPLAVRRLRWRQVRAAIGLKVPRLQWPTAVAMTVLVIGFATAFAVVKAAGARDVWLGLLTLFGGSFVGTLLLALATPLARAFPTGEVTAGDLAKDVLALNYRAFAGGDGAGNRPEVWESLCRVIVKQTGVEREKITPEARIVYDLGID